MQLLLRKCAVNNQGHNEFSDIELAADSIVIGSAPDCDLQLLGAQIAAQHASIRWEGGVARVVAERRCSFEYNGVTATRAELKRGDTLAFAEHTLTVVEAPSGFDLALQWLPGAVDGRFLAKAYRTSLAETRVRPRVVAWTLALLVLLLAGALPLAGYFLRQSTTTAAAPANVDAVLAADKFWSSGPLHAAHRVALDDNCAACHEAPFRAVRDSACQSCHQNMTDHVAPAHPEHALFDGMRCGGCHEEHQESAALVVRESALCVDCHRGRNTPVQGFAADKHPPFRVSLLQPTVKRMQDSFALTWAMQRAPLAATLKENSHLKFSHAAHLSGAKVEDPATGKALECAACHRLLPDREHFEPIAMERSCRQCHDLSFDANRPQQQLPHGEPAAVYETLEAHFIGRAFGLERRSELPQRRMPGRDSDSESCKGDANCAKAQAEREAQRQFTQRGCVTCHVVETFADVDPRARWQVLPVRLTADWYPAARFDHRAHMTQGNAQGSAACLTCHKADVSQNSSDVLLPGLDNCLQCHGDTHAPQGVALQCVSCHAYHGTAAKEANHAGL